MLRLITRKLCGSMCLGYASFDLQHPSSEIVIQDSIAFLFGAGLGGQGMYPMHFI